MLYPDSGVWTAAQVPEDVALTLRFMKNLQSKTLTQVAVEDQTSCTIFATFQVWERRPLVIGRVTG
jgi:hypothetical protein